MAASLEIGKLVAASFVYQYWKIVNWLQKSYMIAAIIILIGITSAGIFGYLSNSYMGATVEFETLLTKLEVYEEQLKTLEEDKVFLKQELEASVNSLPENYITAKRKLRNEYNPMIQEKSVLIGELKNKVGELEIQMVDTGIDVGPLIYISKAFGTDMDTVVKWFMFVLMLVFDPLAVVMIISWNIAWLHGKKEEKRILGEYKVYDDEEYETHDRGTNAHFNEGEREEIIGQNGNTGLHYDEIDDIIDDIEEEVVVEDRGLSWQRDRTPTVKVSNEEIEVEENKKPYNHKAAMKAKRINGEVSQSDYGYHKKQEEISKEEISKEEILKRERKKLERGIKQQEAMRRNPSTRNE